ncbi:MAG: transposase [Intestinibacter bartlettii]|nr:transposase [Intestinibacter bartlettii]
MILTRKIQLLIVGNNDEVNRVFNYIREGMISQNKAMNEYMSALYLAELNKASKEDRKELNQLYGRISNSKKGSAYSQDIVFPKGLPVASSLSMKVKQDFKQSCKNGLMYGKVSLPTYRSDNPLLIHVDYVRLRSNNPHRDSGLYHNYKNHAEFLEHLDNKDLEVFIKFANNITFKLILGNVKKSASLRHEIQMIFEEYYKVCSSSIEIDGRKIILNLSMDIPKEKRELDENVVVGVDVGIAIPAVCGLNINDYSRKYIGSVNDFMRVKTKIQHQKSRLQTNLKMTKGGHGRKRKLKTMDKFTDYERNWVQSYNHYISKQVIDFALKNKAKYINIEDLSGITKGKNVNKFLKGWSYYQLQSFITYKANKYGIEVRKIDPHYTSQTCSCCGYVDEKNRPKNEKGQSYFRCLKCGHEENADFNAAKNIAKSVNFVK